MDELVKGCQLPGGIVRLVGRTAGAGRPWVIGQPFKLTPRQGTIAQGEGRAETLKLSFAGLSRQS